MAEQWDVHARQATLGIDREQSVGVVGVGGIGSWAAVFLALAGIRELHLFDGDVVTVTNLNRLPLGPENVGRDKADAVVELIDRLYRGSEGRVQAHGPFLVNPGPSSVADVFGIHLDWVLVSTDTLRSRREVYDWAQARGVKYIECGAEGDTATIAGSPAGWATAAEEEPGYRSVPVFVGPCALAASVAAYYILKGKHSTSLITRAGWAPATGEVKVTQWPEGGVHGEET